MSELIGTVLQGTYRLERFIGKGGMGKVYEASHLRLDRRFAVKLLIPEAAADEVALARFQREARITSGLGHPHIVEVVDFNTTEEGNPYIVLELLDGESLDDRLERVERLELPVVASIVRQATSALHVAHEKGVVHRDLKPQNLYLCRRGSQDDYVKLLDFGISKVLGSASVVTRTNALVGSPGYMSPEQAEEQADEVDVRSDVYGMGTLIFEMLTGSPPFSASSVPSLLYKIVHQEPPDLCELRPEVPDDIGRVVAIALGKRPEERYGSIDELWQAFSEALESARVAYTDKTRIQHTAWPEQALKPVSTEEVAARRPTEPENPIITDDLLEAANTDEHHHATAIAGRPQRNQVGRSTTLSVSAGELRPHRRRIGPLVALSAAVVAVIATSIVVYVLVATPPDDPGRVAAGHGTDATRQIVGTHSAQDTSSPSVSPLVATDAAPTPDTPARPEPDASVEADLGLQVRLEPTLRPRQRYGTLIVGTLPNRGRPTWGYVYLNGKKIGATPLRRRVRIGVHDVGVKQGTLRASQRVKVLRGRTTTVSLRLR